MLAEAARGEENLQILRPLGMGSLLVVPLLARGEVLGAITCVPIPPPLDRAVKEYFCEDHFHPSAPGYELWGRSLGRAAAEPVRRLRSGG